MLFRKQPPVKWPDEIWEEELSKDIEIGASTEGYDRVSLRCDAGKMTVNLTMSNEFSGVIYTRGSFYSRKDPYLLDPAHGGNFSIDIPFHQCGTVNINDKYKNIILMIQHDDELITPEDAAFILECDFFRSRIVTVSAELNELDNRQVS